MRYTMIDTEQLAFEMFAREFPHEAYKKDAQRFVEFCQRVEPGVTRDDIEQVLKETENLPHGP